jgi:hypothetical protein
MPAYLGGSDRVGIKWVAGFEGNRSKGLPYIYGVFILSDAETGRPQASTEAGSPSLHLRCSRSLMETCLPREFCPARATVSI